MNKKVRMWRWQTLVLAVSALLTVISTVFAGQLCTTQTVSTHNFNGIFGYSDSFVIGVGNNGIIYDYNGSTWNQMPSPTGRDLMDVNVISPTLAFAVGAGGTVLQYNGSAWSVMPFPRTNKLKGVWAYSASDIYAVGNSSTLYWYNGTSWVDQSQAAGTNSLDLENAWGNSGYFYAIDQVGTIYAYNRTAGQWNLPNHTCRSSSGFNVNFNDLWGDAAGNLYLVGQDQSTGLGVVYKYNGTSCTQVATATHKLWGIYGSNATGEIYAAGNSGTVLYYSGGAWQQIKQGNQDLKDVWVSPAGNAYYAGKSGQVTSCVYSAVTPGAFNAVDVWDYTKPVTGKIQTKISAQPFQLDIAALKQKNGQWVLNTGYRGTVQVDLVDASSNLSCAVLPVKKSLGIVTFTKADQGQKTLSSIQYNDALRDARVRMTQITCTGNCGGGNGNQPIACSVDNFAIRPAYFTVTASDQNWTTPGTANILNATTASGTPIHKAGQPFTLTATAVNALSQPTPGYMNIAGFPPLSPAAVATGLVLPATGTLGTASASGWTVNNGVAQSNNATYSEVGAFDLEVIDTSYASVDAGDGTPTCQLVVGLSCANTGYGAYTGPFTGPQPYYAAAPVAVGRFVPDHFAVSYNTPQFATACGAGQFTYLGQPFHYATRPVITVTAQNAQNGTTLNYTGSLWKITDASLAQAPYATQNQRYTLTGAPAGTTLDTGLLPPTSSDPAIVDNGNGTGTLTFSTGGANGGLAVARGTTPVAPFAADISLSLNVIDTDGVTALTNPAAFNNVAFNSGAQMDYGRVALQNAYGSELLDLAVPMTAQYYAGSNTGFLTNGNDSCTASVSLALGPPYSGNLGAGSTCVQDSGSPGASGAGCAAPGPAGEQFKEPPASGNFNLWLKATGAGNTGSVTVTAAVPAWLQFPWTGPANQDPSASASFGLYKGAGPQIYLREVY